MENIKSAIEVWEKAKDLIKSKVNPQTFETWFKPTNGLEISKGSLVLEVPNSFFKDWLLEHHLDLIRTTLKDIADENLALDFRYSAKEPNAFLPAAASSAPKSADTPKKQEAHNNIGLNPAYTFDDFVIGPSNKMAHAAAMAVAESPARAYNPLFIYGKAGMGKTHLMNAIGHCVAAKNPGMKVVYITSEQFTNQLIQSIQNRSTDRFRARYRTVDVLLIDDVHFIAGKESTQEEFFHTFNTLHDAHKQIVLSSDKPPKEIDRLEERLVSRFEWGLIVSISQPDFETRIAILRQKLKRENIAVPDDVIFYIGEKIRSNIRELEGALKRVVANAVLLKQSITLELARSVLKDMVKEKESRILADTIFEEVASYFNVRVSDIKGRRRTKQMVLPRQISMYLIRKLTDHSLPEIGELCGGRDHTTILHACESIESDMKKDAKIKEMIGRLATQIQGE
ncbi:MAG: chromosomal replication initiator protein DnaA [Candidatus Omnitrophica bacterium]|nr:chromosomal replication initiator protein DnaA [Candidatus Omnitrophota bacterium]MDD5310202.1 chromosomal replication initiator protein DnaA [Candidatus Omnitrophota bacterium]MDD5546221.1 chromosomal replication initiator protein DnaA [Candidatus Omnitrophota bacterium]